MDIDEKEFFRETTLRICGSLDVETFLYDSFMYIRNFVPADKVVLSYYDPEKRQHIVLAEASVEGSSILNLKGPVPSEIRSFMKRPDLEPVVVDRAEQHPTARPWIARGLINKNASLLVLRLILNETNVGAATFFAEERGTFSREHADLLSLLREPFSIALSNSVRYQKLLELKDLLAEDNRFLQNELLQTIGDEIVGADFGLKDVMDKVHQVAPLSSPVLLLGETGTGKEVIAGAIHNLSPRKSGPFIKVNCGAIPENLVDSELFGHEKGAFTGALSRKRGRFERAKGGTIFLDEVGELQPDAQVRLLRVLQDKEIERVGGTEPISVDIRVIAATHRNLEIMIREGTFREDLYFRLKVFPITIPPLRERTGDIPALLQYFLHNKAQEIGKRSLPSLAPGALERLMAYPWPGNVRELENAVERALILNKGEPLVFHDLSVPLNPEFHFKQDLESEFHLHLQDKNPLALDAVMSGHIRRVLEMTDGKVEGKGGAAELLQINPSTLRKRMRKLGIPFGRKMK